MDHLERRLPIGARLPANAGIQRTVRGAAADAEHHGEGMRLTLRSCLAICLTVLITGCSPRDSGSSERTPVPAATLEQKTVAVVVTAKSASWKLADTQHFDVIVRNGTPDVIKVPYIYDALIEIDGRLYTQFPKPKLAGEAQRVIQGHSNDPAGAVTLNGPFSTVDAKTGKLPLNLAIGEHKLVLICGPYRSNTVTFELVE